MIAIINYDVPNLGNIVCTMEHIDIPLRVVSTPNEIKGTEKIFFLGLGAFGRLPHVEERAKPVTSGRHIVGGHASALATGNLFVPHGRNCAVLFRYPAKSEPEGAFSVQEQV